MRGDHGIDGVNFGVAVLHAHRAQRVFGLQGIDGQRIGLQRKQVDHWHAVQAQLLFAEAEVMFPAFRQHDVDFKPRQSGRKSHRLQPAQIDEHELFAEGKILQQQLVTAKTAAIFRPEAVILAKSQRAEIPVQRPSVHLIGHAQPHPGHIEGKGLVHGAGQRRIGVAVQRDMTEIDPAPVRQLAAGKAQRDHRPAIRIGGQLDAFQG